MMAEDVQALRNWQNGRNLGASPHDEARQSPVRRSPVLQVSIVHETT
jgi:hypothetical protein